MVRRDSIWVSGQTAFWMPFQSGQGHELDGSTEDNGNQEKAKLERSAMWVARPGPEEAADHKESPGDAEGSGLVCGEMELRPLHRCMPCIAEVMMAALAGEVELLEAGVGRRVAQGDDLDLQRYHAKHDELSGGDAEADAVEEAGLPDGFAEDDAEQSESRGEAQRPDGAVVVFAGPGDGEEAGESGFGGRVGRRICHGWILAVLLG